MTRVQKLEAALRGWLAIFNREGAYISPLVQTAMDDTKAALESEAETIIVKMDGGLVESVEGIPAGLTIEVRNYEMGLVDDDDERICAPFQEAPYFRTVWTGK